MIQVKTFKSYDLQSMEASIQKFFNDHLDIEIVKLRRDLHTGIIINLKVSCIVLFYYIDKFKYERA